MNCDVTFFSVELEKEYEELEKSNPKLYKAITNGIEKLKINRRSGKKIPMDQISKRFVQMYDTKHFWKLDISREWRLVYALKGNYVRILAIILNWFDNHKQYRKEVYK